MRIRQAEPADVAALRRIVEAAYGPYVARIGQRPGPMLDDYAALVAQGAVWVAGEPAPPVGFQVRGLIVLLPQSDHLLLDNIAVDPAAHGQGIGRALLAFAEAEARRRSIAELRLYTHQMMTENIALYNRSGWQETGRGVQNGFPRVFFRKSV